MSPKSNKKEYFDLCENCHREYERKGVVTDRIRQRFGRNSDKDCCLICKVPLCDGLDESDLKNSKEDKLMGNDYTMYILIVCLICMIAGISYYFKPSSSSNDELNLKLEVANLKEKYQNQNRELWRNVWKIVNDSEENVQSLVLLYKKNGAITAECFAKDLMKIINKILNGNDILIYENRNDVVDYGEVLTHYLEVVKETKHIIVPRLQDVNGNTARIFHTLCEIGPHSIRPSYYIFTLEDTSDKIAPELQNKIPLVRAGHILRNSWNNLLENELHPLISRVVRNVAELSDINVSC